MDSISDLQRLLETLHTELALSFGPAQSLLSQALRDSRKILLCGNGGSCAQSSHFASELVVRYHTDRPALAALVLSDAGVITAAADDYGYSRIYARQIEALGQPGDVLVAFTTSAKCDSIREAVATARHRGLLTLGISGSTGLNCDTDIRVPSTHPARIQECHLLITHLLCEALGA